MPYIHHDKITSKLRLFSNITSLSKTLDIKKDKLYTCFSRNKFKEYSNKEYNIFKVEMERVKPTE